ncbi:MAG: nucleotide exchange factor GrpE [Lentisphaeria bacterium]|nr:nucleotide exchange factor GrpE [Lentisphaeria bacterium]
MSEEEKQQAAENACTEQEENTAPEAEKTAPEETTEEKLQKELKEWQDKYLYLQAEYQNYRKRVVKDIADARSYTAADTLSPFLSVYDYLSMAGMAAEQSDNLDAIRMGLKMIMGEFFKAFDELGVKKLESAGTKFDPNIHEAVANEASDTVPEGEIIREWNCGFKMGEKLLRPARVVVSSGKAEEENTSENFPAEEAGEKSAE